MNSVKIRANAKVNLWLDITGKRPDGYHTLRTVMLSVGIADTVSVARRESGISVSCNDAGVPTGEQNIAWKAAAAFLTRAGLSGGAEIKIEKNIPVQAGMGGGSADAAAVLWGMNLLFDLPLAPQELYGLGLTVGADVPFCLCGGCTELSGLGEEAENRFPLPETWLVLVKPAGGVSTPAAYGELARLYPAFDAKRSLAPLREALLRAEPLETDNLLYNIFEDVLPALSPETREVLAAMRKLTPAALLSGSGNAVFGLFESSEAAQAALLKIMEQFPGIPGTVTSPEPKGLVVEETE